MNGRFGEKRKIFETLDGEEIWKGEKILRIRNVEYKLKEDWNLFLECLEKREFW